MRNKKIFSVIGLVLQIAGGLGMTILQQFAVYGIIVFIAGSAILFFGYFHFITNFIVTITFVFITILYVPYSILSSLAEPEVIMIPSSFRGRVYIIYDEPCGSYVTRDTGKRIYKIPPNGILICKDSSVVGYLNREFYFVDSTGSITEAKEISRESEIIQNTLGIYNEKEDTIEPAGMKSFRCDEFYVVQGRKMVDSFNTDKYKQLADSIQLKVLNECRGSLK